MNKVKVVLEFDENYIEGSMKKAKVCNVQEMIGLLNVEVGKLTDRTYGAKLFKDYHIEIEEEPKESKDTEDKKVDCSMLKPGDKVRIKRHLGRPSHWNERGEMDKYQGQIVTINELDKYSLTYDFDILADEGASQEKWWFAWSDVEEIIYDNCGGISRDTFAKLRPGDKVRIKRYKRGDIPSYWNWSGKMDKYVGKVVTIKKTDDVRIYVNDSACDRDWAFEMTDIAEVISMQDNDDDCCEHCPCNCKKKK